MADETIWLGHDNTIDLQLKKDGVALTNDEMDAITMITASFGSILISSENEAGDPIRWRQSGYDTGEIRIDVGGESIPPRTYNHVWLVVYDASNTEGVVWSTNGEAISVDVRSEVEAGAAV